MRWKYVEPTSATDPTPVEHVLTENEILERYYPTWTQQAMRWNAEHPDHPPIPITPKTCIEDWITVHWAEPVEGEQGSKSDIQKAWSERKAPGKGEMD